jgi:hypothetical protein
MEIKNISQKTTIAVPSRWMCDGCGEWINSPEQGWLEWDRQSVNGTSLNAGFRIVHHRLASPRQNTQHGCYDPRKLQGNHLNAYVGEEGMSRLFAFLDPMPGGTSTGCCTP